MYVWIEKRQGKMGTVVDFNILGIEIASQPRYCQENRHGKCDTESVDS